MKKITAIFLITIYSLTTLGIGIRQFYCCGKLKSTNITLVQEAKEKCSNSDGMKGCCKTQFKSLKVKDSHFAADGITAFVKHFSDLHVATPLLEVKAPANEPVVVANASNAPPPKLNGVPVYILNCTYRI
ncbi:hypothetical protein [Ferruginibacter sp. SUN106]|uniref:hypothetical protein n=1 Tax=Ferruginibacter sp. SUN106 TaxID=2978348 RepID=UPI003D35E2BC